MRNRVQKVRFSSPSRNSKWLKVSSGGVLVIILFLGVSLPECVAVCGERDESMSLHHLLLAPYSPLASPIRKRYCIYEREYLVPINTPDRLEVT